MEKRAKQTTPAASRRGFLAGLAAGVGMTAAVLGPKRAQAQAAKSSGPVLFHRTAETEKYYKTLTRQ